MSADDKPVLERIDYQCLLGMRSSVTAAWFGSDEPIEVVAGWYRRNLEGYGERAPNDWKREGADGADVVVVAAAGQWPEGTPAPPGGWGDRFRTLVLESSMTRHTGTSTNAAVEQPRANRRRWFRLPRLGARRRQ